MSQDIGLSCLSCLSRYLYLSDYLSLCQSPPHQPVQREHLNVTRAWSPAIQLILGLRESYLSSGFMSHPATYQAVPTVVAFPKVTSYEELQRWMRIEYSLSFRCLPLSLPRVLRSTLPPFPPLLQSCMTRELPDRLEKEGRRKAEGSQRGREGGGRKIHSLASGMRAPPFVGRKRGSDNETRTDKHIGIPDIATN